MASLSKEHTIAAINVERMEIVEIGVTPESERRRARVGPRSYKDRLGVPEKVEERWGSRVGHFRLDSNYYVGTAVHLRYTTPCKERKGSP